MPLTETFRRDVLGGITVSGGLAAGCEGGCVVVDSRHVFPVIVVSALRCCWRSAGILPRVHARRYGYAGLSHVNQLMLSPRVQF